MNCVQKGEFIMMSGPLDFLFDFNGNNELDPIEEAMLIDSLNDMQKNDSSKKSYRRGWIRPG